MATREDAALPGDGAAPRPGRGTALEVFLVALRLGLTSFGGPVAHLGYFRREYVARRGWLDEEQYADLVALCQFLPGPASSEVGIAVGMGRAGLRGGLAAWLGFTLPSACALAAAALLLRDRAIGDTGAVHGLLVVAVAVVASAVWGMARTFAAGYPRAAIASLSAAGALVWTSPANGVVTILVAGAIGRLFLRRQDIETAHAPAGSVPTGSAGWKPALPVDTMLSGATARPPASVRRAIVAWALFFGLLLLLPLLRGTTPGRGWGQGLAVVDSFYRAGALTFGGGHVALPLLQREVVPSGWVTNKEFVAGYGAAQAVPGPLFTFAAYLGAARHGAPSGVIGAALSTVAIFLPSFLLVAGALPLWERLRRREGVRAALRGVNAAVVGLLAATLYRPVFTSAIHGPGDLGLALLGLALLLRWTLPPLLVVAVIVAISAAFAAV